MTNCLFFVLRLYFSRWRKAVKRGEQFNDYILIRPSRVPFGICHFLYGRYDSKTDQVKLISYKPKKKYKSGVEIIFHGYVQRGDREF
jgi:hypothetical protein